MTENNIISRLHLHCKTMTEEESFAIMDFLDELKQYRAIGTIEEFKALKDKSEPRKMSIGNDNGKSRKCCGNCRCFVLPTSNYCSKCGQKLDWQ